MGCWEEAKKGLAVVKSDCSKIKGCKDCFGFVLDMVCHAFMGCFGGSCGCMWNLLYNVADYEKKMMDSDELVRNEHIGSLIQKHAPPRAALLDVGCGTAVCLPVWQPALGSYTGLDISSAAIRVAQKVHDARKPDDSLEATFVTGSMQSFRPAGGRLFDVVVFNECLYYCKSFKESVEVMKGAMRMLNDGGLIVISICDISINDALWTAVEAILPAPLETTTVTAPSTVSWSVRVYKVPTGTGANASPSDPLLR